MDDSGVWAKGAPVSFDSGSATHSAISEFGSSLFSDLVDSPAPCDNYSVTPSAYLNFGPIHHQPGFAHQDAHPLPIQPAAFSVPHIPISQLSGPPTPRAQWPPFAPPDPSLVFSGDFGEGLPHDNSGVFCPFSVMRYPCESLSSEDTGSSGPGGFDPRTSSVASHFTSCNSALSSTTISPKELKMKISPSPSPDAATITMSRPSFSASLQGRLDPAIQSPTYSPAVFNMDLEQYHLQALSLDGSGHVDASNIVQQQQQQNPSQCPRMRRPLSPQSEQLVQSRTGRRTVLPDRPPRPLAILPSNDVRQNITFRPVNQAGNPKRHRPSASAKKLAELMPKKRSSAPSESRHHPSTSSGHGSLVAQPPTNSLEGPSADADHHQAIDLPQADEKHAKDLYLLSMKRSGMTYREIRTKGNFTEAESTLRGRYRTLTKSKNERVRKPEWSLHDIHLLNSAVEEYANGEDPAGVKIPWKKVAEYIAEHGGSYHFGNATCRKKYDEQFPR